MIFRKLILTLSLAAFSGAGAAAAPHEAAGAQTSAKTGAQFKGPYVLQQEISRRLIQNAAPFYLNRYGADPHDQSLLSLLGSWLSPGTEHTYHNGQPNSVNMLLWYMLFSGFADDLGSFCLGHRPFKLNATAAAVFAVTCRWPADEAKTEQAMANFWIAVAGYDAPEEEFTAWREFFLTSSYAQRPPMETVSAMSLAITMNPYFLLTP